MQNLIYGTAWKEAATSDLVSLALRLGFRAIDTANQAKHYSEALVGEALKKVVGKEISRNKLWLQSKFTSLDGQDHRLPYDAKAGLAEQVRQSCASSLHHLNTDYLDSYLLHGPYNYPSLGTEDFIVWDAMEELYKKGVVKSIGISNVNYQQLKMLIDQAEIKPMIVQNRCYANKGWDKQIRELCKKHSIAYQGFSLLTANPDIVSHPEVVNIATKYDVLPAGVIFKFATQIGINPLTGTTSAEHMSADLNIIKFDLSNDEVAFIEALGMK
ncbi:MAG: aldo/keto reductase [Rickettsiales bacterium]|mgnify:CR=1 FL=1|jgi:diketogulonate reductase-like aldo/keto reductase|nr:aldo/keto reductase [Rickettsiales bacterium]